MSHVGFVGLGAMGRLVARNLLAAGHAVTVWNRSPGAVTELVQDGAVEAVDVADAFRTEVVFTMLADDNAVRSIALDPDVLAAAAESGRTIHVNLSTISANMADSLATASENAGVGYIACPVFGSINVARTGQLNLLAAGHPELIDRVQPLLDVIGKRTWRVGERPTQANTVKIIGNYLMACALQSLGEAMSLADSVEIPPNTLVEILTNTIFPGNIYSTYGKVIGDRSFVPASFTAHLGLKDVGLALSIAESAQISLPLGGILRDAYEQVIRNGRGDEDWSVISDLLPRGQATRNQTSV